MDRYDDCQPKDLSMKCNKRLKPIPPPLNLGENALKEFAIIATGPKSPLMQKNLPFRKRAHSLSGATDIQNVSVITSRNQPTSTNTVSENILKEEESACSTPSTFQKSLSEIKERNFHQKEGSTCSAVSVIKSHRSTSSVLESPNLTLQNTSTTWSPTGQINSSNISSVLLSPVGSSREELNNSINIHPWPSPVWHCFQKGTYVKLDMPSGGNKSPGLFRLVEEHGPSDWLGALQLERVEEDLSSAQVCLQFRCLGTGVYVTAQCHSLHTFFVKNKGWCAVYPDRVSMHYQVACLPIERGDICSPPQSLSPDVCERFKRFSFPPEEISVPTPFILSPPSSPCKKPSDADRPKRPMNAFMLFAKRYRLELIQMHPGKDNRAISVLLGEAWRKLPPAAKEEYVLEARAMAQEQKRLHPDCWKRKRSHSTS